jgi:sRNA-binding protein
MKAANTLIAWNGALESVRGGSPGGVGIGPLLYEGDGDPKMRRPLKKDILADLQREGLLAPSFRSAVGWYQGNFGYQYTLQAGTKRIDLDGKEVDTVTKQEQRDVKKYIAERKRVQRENHSSLAIPMATSLHQINNTLKGAAPFRAAARTPTMDVGSPLARLMALVEGVDRALTDTANLTLRTTFGLAGLQTVAAEVQAQIEKIQKLNGGSHESS